MSHNSKTGRILTGFNHAIHRLFARLAVPLLCGLALLLPPAPARAAIALVDDEFTTASTFGNTSTALLLATNLTVSASANTLVVEVTFRNSTATTVEAPATLSWTNGVAAAQTLTRVVEKGSKASSGGRNSAIYYLYNPTAGTGFNISGKLSGQVGSSGALVAYTLSGVDTTVTSPPTNCVTQSGGGADTTLAFTINGISVGSWAAVGGVIAEADSVHTITSGSGTPVLTVTSGGFSSASTAAMGYLSTIAGGSDAFTYTFTSSSSDGAFAAAVFAPGPGAPIIVSQPQSEIIFTNVPAHFSVTGSGVSLTYQWYLTSSSTLPLVNAVALAGATKYGGTNTSILTVSNVVTGDLTNYAVVITNSFGAVTSSVASLSVVLPYVYENAVLTNGPAPFAFYTFSETADPELGNVVAYDSMGGFNGTYGMGGAADQGGSGAENGADGIAGPQATANGLIGFPDNNTALGCLINNFPLDSYVTAPPFNLNNGAGTNVLTITAWIYPEGNQPVATGLVMSRSGTTTAGLCYDNVTNSSGGARLGYNWNGEAGAYNWDSGLTPPPNMWSLVALMITPTNNAIYLINANGFQISTHVYNHVPQIFEGPTLIGSDSLSNARNFNGVMDEVALSNQAMTPSQISALYAAASGTLFPPPPPTIITQPRSESVFSGATAQFGVTASGFGLSYQWYLTSSSTLPLVNAVALATATKYAGTNTSTLSVSNVVTGDLTNYAVVISNSYGAVTSSIASLAFWPSPVLQLRMPFTNTDAGDPSTITTASDTSSGGIAITMNMFTNGTVTGDFHGAAGTGVTISNPNARALDMSTNTSPAQANNQPVNYASDIVDLLGSPTLATLGDGSGNITNFVATIWAKMSAPFFAPAGAGAPRLWTLNAGGIGLDVPNVNTLGFQFLNTNQLQFGYSNVKVAVNYPAGNFIAGQWYFFAMTYDGSNYKIYYGTDTSAVQLLTNVPASGQTIVLGSSASLQIGNRTTDYSRSLNGWLEDFRFYNNPGDSNFVESVRASLAPLPAIPVIAAQPVPITVYPGQTAQFTALVGGTAPITNQWYFGSTKLSDGTQGDGSFITNSGTTTLTIANVHSADAGSYYLTATNSGGGTNSATVLLTVLATGPATNFTLNFPGTNVVEANGSDWDTVGNWNPYGLSATVSATYANPGSSFELLTGSRLRTPATAGIQVFPGVKLTVDGSGVFENDTANPTNVSELRFKDSSLTPTNYFSNLVLNGGQLDQGVNVTEVIEGTVTVSNNSAIYIDSGATSVDRSYQIDSFLTGSGNLFWHQFDGTLGGFDLAITGATNTFSGQWIVDQGALVGVGTNSLGTNNLIVGTNGLTAAVETLYNINDPNGSLILGANGKLFLHQTNSFASVTVNGTVLPVGIYTAANLNSVYPANFPATWTQQAGSTFTAASGEIIVLGSSGPPKSPHITGFHISGSSLSLSATNGTAGGLWLLLQSTNVALPLNQWQTNLTGNFDGSGDLSTNITSPATNPQEFYLLKVQ